MAASIAHEINQPLSAIANYTNAAYRRVSAGRIDGDKLSASLIKIDEQAQRAGEVVRRLRNLVKKRESQRELLDINDLVSDSLRLAEVDARIHDVVVDASFTESPSRVLADPVQIEQVILNLLRNAIDAMGMVPKNESRLMVRTEERDNFVEVSVCDRGTGITKVHEKHLFEPFFTTKVAGMGMGLSISHSIVSAHGGRFWFTRNPERGVTFHFSLPKAAGWLE
jgi:C4-dicarboxylate-specific signal transduction histidine kinase